MFVLRKTRIKGKFDLRRDSHPTEIGTKKTLNIGKTNF